MNLGAGMGFSGDESASARIGGLDNGELFVGMDEKAELLVAMLDGLPRPKPEGVAPKVGRLGEGDLEVGLAELGVEDGTPRLVDGASEKTPGEPRGVVLSSLSSSSGSSFEGVAGVTSVEGLAAPRGFWGRR